MKKKELTDAEHELLCSVMQEVEAQYDEDAGAQLEYVDHDENWVYMDVYYDEGEGEEVKLDRELLSSGKSASEIALEVN